MDFEEARMNMLDGQVRSNDVTNHKLRSALGTIPREKFVPKSLRGVAYANDHLEIAEGRYLMDPRAFAKLAQAVEIKPDDLVLLVGCGTGYGAAVLGTMADSVVALESDEALADQASANLAELEIDNVAVVTGDLKTGLADQGPYDVILFDGALPERSEVIEKQLADLGRLGVIVQKGVMGTAYVITRDEDRFVDVPIFDVSAPLLPGFEVEPSFEF